MAPDSDDMLRRLIDAVPVLISYVDSGCRYRFNNAAYEAWFGIRQEEIAGRHLREVLGEATYRRVAPYVAKALSGERVSFEDELPYQSGGTRYVAVEYVPDIGPDGSPRGMFAVISDLTERRRNGQEIRRLNAELRQRLDEMQAIFDAAPIGIFVGRDAECREMVANRAGVRMLRVPVGSNPSKSGPLAHGLAFRIFRDGRELTPSELPMQRAARTGLVIKDEEIQVRFPDHTETILSTHSAPLYDEQGHVRGCVGTFVDVTERHRIEQALAEMDRRKNSFLAMLAHELRNPLAAMEHALQAAGPAVLDDRVAGILRRQTAHLMRLVDDLLDVARITKGLVKVQLEPLELCGLLRETAIALEPALEGREQRLRLELPDDEVWIEGDAVRLTQVFSNLISNASNYSPADREVTLSLELEAGQAVAIVEDQGAGIAEEDLPFVFDPFVQAGRLAERPTAGLGLGLTLVKELTVLHGGAVEARSEGPGRGSRFTVFLPLAGRRERKPARENHRKSSLQPLSGLRVLLVEDNPDVADSLQLLLSAGGASVHCVYRGKEAAPAVADFHPDVVLLDIGMPDIDGRDVARELREMKERDGFSVIAVSGHAAEDVATAGLDRPLFDAALSKPVSIDALADLLRQVRPR